MEECVPANRIYQFRDRLKEVSVYTLETFIVADVQMKWKTTDHPYKIKITQLTKIEKIIPQPEKIPFIRIQAKLSEILQTLTENNTLIRCLPYYA
jgi:hypothetical protein